MVDMMTWLFVTGCRGYALVPLVEQELLTLPGNLSLEQF